MFINLFTEVAAPGRRLSNNGVDAKKNVKKVGEYKLTPNRFARWCFFSLLVDSVNYCRQFHEHKDTDQTEQEGYYCPWLGKSP